MKPPARAGGAAWGSGSGGEGHVTGEAYKLHLKVSDGVTQILKFDLDGCWEKKHNSESPSEAQQRTTSPMTRTFGFPRDWLVVGGLVTGPGGRGRGSSEAARIRMNRLFFVPSSFSRRCSSAGFSSLLASAWRSWTCSGRGGTSSRPAPGPLIGNVFDRRGRGSAAGNKSAPTHPSDELSGRGGRGGTWGSNKRRTMDPHWRSALFHPSCCRGNAVFFSSG